MFERFESYSPARLGRGGKRISFSVFRFDDSGALKMSKTGFKLCVKLLHELRLFYRS